MYRCERCGSNLTYLRLWNIITVAFQRRIGIVIGLAVIFAPKIGVEGLFVRADVPSRRHFPELFR